MRKQKQMSATQSRQFIINDRTPFAVLEAYKALRTNLMFSLPGKGCKKILITSSTPGEGKSTTAINLSKVFAMNGEKVLLVDCDLRLSTAAAKMNLKNAPGLSDVLVGMEDLSESIHHMRDGLDVLTAGSTPPNPSELLGSEAMQILMAQLESSYKYIILDATPIAAVTDASVLARLASGVVLVVRNGVAERDVVGNSLDQLRLAGAKVLGFVFTSADEGRKGYKKSYYGYYGYGESAGNSKASSRTATRSTAHPEAKSAPPQQAKRSSRSAEKDYPGKRGQS